MALTELFTFKLGDSGLVLNSDFTGIFPFVDIQKASGFDSPPFRETQRDHEGTDGGFLDAEFEKGRQVTLEGQIYADPTGVEYYLDQLKSNWAPSRTLIPLYFTSDSTAERVLFVKPQGCRYNWETIRRTGTIAVQFQAFAEDPRIYSSDLHSIVIPYGDVTTSGFDLPVDFPFGFGPTTDGTPPSGVFVSGNRETPATLIINGPVTNPRVVNETLSMTLQFNLVLGGTDTLVIDLANRTVQLNGTTNKRGSLQDPNWFLLMPGTSFIKYQGNNGTGSSLTIQFRDAWR